MALVTLFNAATPTTAKVAPVTSGTSIKTMLQVKPSATLGMKITAWGISTTAPASTATFSVELLQTDVAATVTAFVNADMHRVDAEAVACGDLTTNLIQVGTTASGYTSTGEGSITAVRLFDARSGTLSTAQGYEYSIQYPLGQYKFVEVAKFARIRVHMSVAVDVVCWMTVEV